MKANLTTDQKAGLYSDFHKAFKNSYPKGLADLTNSEIAAKWDILLEEFKKEQTTHPGRERLKRLGFKIEEPLDESKRTDRKAAGVGS